MPREENFRQTLRAKIGEFCLHAAARSGADDRLALKQLCCCIARSPLDKERVQTGAAGQVALKS